MVEENKQGIFGGIRSLVGNTIEVLNTRLSDTLSKAKSSEVHPLQRISVTENTEIAHQDYRFLDRFTYLSDDTLNQMANKNVIVAAIVYRRCAQIAKFAKPARGKHAMGFKWELAPGAEPSDDDPAIQLMLEEFVMNTGFKDPNRPKEERMCFDEFLRRQTRDALVYDRVATEKIPTVSGSLYAFLPIDAGTIKFARQMKRQDKERLESLKTPNLDIDKEQNRVVNIEHRLEDAESEDIKFVQVINNIVTSYYTHDDISFKTVNPTNEVRLNGYSMGPLEKLITIITSHLFAELHNKSYFTQGFSNRGIIAIKGNVPQASIDGFRRQYYATVSGGQNSYRTPIIGGENVEVQWIPMQMNNRDMEWNTWMQYLVKVICAVYLISPVEIGWGSEATGGTVMGDSGKRNLVLLTESKDVGLEPLLKLFESIINEDVISYFDDEIASRYVFKFVGLGADNPVEDTSLAIQQLSNFKTLNEVRTDMELPPIPPPLGDMILNSMLIPFYETIMFPEPGGDDETDSVDKKSAKKTKKNDNDNNDDKSSKPSSRTAANNRSHSQVKTDTAKNRKAKKDKEAKATKKKKRMSNRS